MADSLKGSSKDDPVYLYIYTPSNRAMRVYKAWVYLKDSEEDKNGLVRVEYKAYADISKKLTTLVPEREMEINKGTGRGLTLWTSKRKDEAIEILFTDARLSQVAKTSEELAQKLIRLQEERDQLFYRMIHVQEPRPYRR